MNTFFIGKYFFAISLFKIDIDSTILTQIVFLSLLQPESSPKTNENLFL